MAIGGQKEQQQQPPLFGCTANLAKIERGDKIGQREGQLDGGNPWIAGKCQNGMGMERLGGAEKQLKTTKFAFNPFGFLLEKCGRMDQIVLSSSSDGEENTPILDDEAAKDLAPELSMAEKLMHELECEDGGEKKAKKRGGRKSAAEAKKLKVKNGGVKKEAAKKKEAPKKQKKAVKKDKADTPAKAKKQVESSDDGAVSDSELDNGSSTDMDMEKVVPMSTAKMAKKDKMKAEKDAEKYAWIKTGHLPAGFMQFGQCSDCGDAQKQLDEVVGEDHQGLYCRVVQCKSCLQANRKIRSLQEKIVSGNEKTPHGNFEFVAEADDYKAAVLVYVRQLGQCGYCKKKQHKIDPAYEKLGHGHVAIKVAMCSLCVFMNKSLQKLYWDGFSSWNKKGSRGAKKGSKKRGRKCETSSDSSSSEDDSDDEPAKKKKPMKKAGKKAAKKSKMAESDED